MKTRSMTAKDRATDQPLLFTNLYDDELIKESKKWVEKVLGDENEIREALMEMKKIPENSVELQKVMFKRRHEKLQNVLEDAEKQGQYAFY
jgi:hypothetical protein